MRFIVGSEPWELAIVALFSHLLANFVGEVVRVGMESFCVPLIRGVAEHEALITCAEVLFVLLGPHTVSDFFTLGLDIDDDVALAAVETDIVVGVANSFGDFTSDLLEVDLLFSDAGLSEKHDLKNTRCQSMNCLTMLLLVAVSIATLASGLTLMQASRIPSDT